MSLSFFLMYYDICTTLPCYSWSGTPVASAGVPENLILRVSSTSIPGAAVAGAQFTEGDQLQVKFILQLSGLLSQICNTQREKERKETDHFGLLPKPKAMAALLQQRLLTCITGVS